MIDRRFTLARLARAARKNAPLALLPLALACGQGSGLTDRLHPTGSQTLATSADHGALYVANEAEGTVARVDPATGAIDRVEVGGEPSRVARAGGFIFVSLSAARAVVVLEDVGGKLRVVERIAVGAEPSGLVASEDGARVFVAETTQDRVSEIDPVARRVVRSWSVPGQPRGLALHPAGRALFATSSLGGDLWRIDLGADGAAPAKVAMPTITGFNEAGPVDLARRFTGDPAFTPDGETLLVPGLWVDNETEVVEPEPGAPIDELPPPGGAYDRAGRFNPAIAVVPVDELGEPAAVEAIEVVSIATFNGGPLVSYPTSVTVEPSGETALVSMEGGAGVVVLAIEAPEPSGSGFLDVLLGGDRHAEPPVVDGGVGFAFRRTGGVGTDRGPNGVAMMADGRAFVAAFLDRTVAPIDVATVRALVDDSALDGPSAVAVAAPFPGNERFFQFRAGPSITVETSRLPAEVERGRQLFFAADDPKMASLSAGVSCATCHPQGRNDGLTWHFARGPRQTPSLAGKVSETEPVGWGGEKATVAIDAMATSQGLMGGRGMVDADAAALAAFIDHTRDADVPLRGVEGDAAALRGQALFEREDVGCVSCHAGERLTDNRNHEVRGTQLQTPTLVGVSVTAPYLHDGSAPTLRDVLRDLSHDGESTVVLTEEELDELAQYLRML